MADQTRADREDHFTQPMSGVIDGGRDLMPFEAEIARQRIAAGVSVSEVVADLAAPILAKSEAMNLRNKSALPGDGQVSLESVSRIVREELKRYGVI